MSWLSDVIYILDKISSSPQTQKLVSDQFIEEYFAPIVRKEFWGGNHLRSEKMFLQGSTYVYLCVYF